MYTVQLKITRQWHYNCNRNTNHCIPIKFQSKTCIHAGPLQQSMETCTALDMMITNRDVENIGMCTRNTLCTMITCRRTVTIPISIIVTNEMTILPCETPVAVRAVTTALLSGSSPMTFINETITESRDVTPPGIAAALGTISFMLTQTDTGINFGVSYTA